MMTKRDVLPPSADNPRNSEGSMIKLHDGTILFAYSHFYGGAKDNAPAFIGMRRSSDLGRAWTSSTETLIPNEGTVNVMSVSFLRLSNDHILLGYLVKSGVGLNAEECLFFVRRSADEGRTWSERTEVTIPGADGNFFVVNNDRLVQLSRGRIIVPAAVSGARINSCACAYFSDDMGITWQRSAALVVSPNTMDDWAGLEEPGIIELKDGRLLMWMRTDLGTQFFSYSADRGEHWTEPMPSHIVSPCSPASIKRIPHTGDLLAIYNDSLPRYMYIRKDPRNSQDWPGERTPLVAAISRDEGKTWRKHFLIEDDPEGRFCYTSILFEGKQALLSYTAEKQKNETRTGWGLLRVTVLDLDDVYARP